MQRTLVEFPGADGHPIQASLDHAPGDARAFALLVHCFGDSSSTDTSEQLSIALTAAGFSVLRFAFGGRSLADLQAAVAWLTRRAEAPKLLVGHGWAGTACRAAAQTLPGVEALALISAPADARSAARLFPTAVSSSLAQQMAEALAGAEHPPRYPVLILHSPADTLVDIQEAGTLFGQLKHPKSFISLNQADHELTQSADACFAAEMIATWARRYVSLHPMQACAGDGTHAVTVWETGQSAFQNLVCADGHALTADEPVDVGGEDTGASPFALVAAGLGACTNMTLRMYATHKGLQIDRLRTTVTLTKTPDGTQFERILEVGGDIDTSTQARLLAIANKCPVHKLLETGVTIKTRLQDETS